jgi:hypothetical protein
MAGSRCRVSFTDSDGILHGVDVDAESLYEAVAIAVAQFREDDINTLSRVQKPGGAQDQAGPGGEVGGAQHAGRPGGDYGAGEGAGAARTVYVRMPALCSSSSTSARYQSIFSRMYSRLH